MSEALLLRMGPTLTPRPPRRGHRSTVSGRGKASGPRGGLREAATARCLRRALGVGGNSNLLDASLSPDLGSQSCKLVWSMTTLMMRQVRGKTESLCTKQRFCDLWNAEATISFPSLQRPNSNTPLAQVYPPHFGQVTDFPDNPHPHPQSYISQSRHQVCSSSKNI